MTKKIRLLAACDGGCYSGFEVVSEAILSRLAATGEYEIMVNAINYWGQSHDLPYRLEPADRIDVGRNAQAYDYLGARTLPMRIERFNPNVVWLFNDVQVIGQWLKSETVQQCNVVTYFPVDGRPISPVLLNPLRQLAKVNVTYTEFGRSAVKESIAEMPVEVIPHGVDTSIFFPLPEEKRALWREHLGLADRFMVLRVDTFSLRKNYGATIKAMAMIAKKVPNLFFYPHCEWRDSGDLHAIIDLHPQLDDKVGRITFTDPTTGKPFEGVNSVPPQVMNVLYNIADAHITTTMGEGFGFSTAEAMACKTPVVGTNYAATAELIADRRGWPIEVDRYLTTGFGVEHAIVNERSAASALLQINRDKAAVQERIERAYEYIKRFNWDSIAKQWDQVFRSFIR